MLPSRHGPARPGHLPRHKWLKSRARFGLSWTPGYIRSTFDTRCAYALATCRPVNKGPTDWCQPAATADRNARASAPSASRSARSVLSHGDCGATGVCRRATHGQCHSLLRHRISKHRARRGGAEARLLRPAVAMGLHPPCLVRSQRDGQKTVLPLQQHRCF